MRWFGTHERKKCCVQVATRSEMLDCDGEGPHRDEMSRSQRMSTASTALVLSVLMICIGAMEHVSRKVVSDGGFPFQKSGHDSRFPKTDGHRICSLTQA